MYQGVFRFFWVDAFTSQPFKGNPAVVCVGEKEVSSVLMQQIASEFGVSETAFVQPLANGFSLRWFTPEVEVDLCGHATLSAARVLWQHGYASSNSDIIFHTASGILKASPGRKGIWLDFPSVPVQKKEIPRELVQAIGVQPVFTGKAGDDWFIELDSEKAVKNAQPDFGKLGSLWKKGVIITSSATKEIDFVSRYFAPGEGIDEDPVTGSAHCSLCWYWSRRLGKNVLKARQLSSRGGELTVKPDRERIRIQGEALILGSGSFNRMPEKLSSGNMK